MTRPTEEEYAEFREEADGVPAEETKAELDDTVTLPAYPAFPLKILPSSAFDLTSSAAKCGLPAALVAGATLAALAAAVGGSAEIRITSTWVQRAILWVPLIAPPSAGKSPSQDLAFDPLRAVNATAIEGEDFLLADVTLEALARELAAHDGCGTLDIDELSVLLSGLGEYKQHLGGDRGRFLGLWSGGPWSLTRVGASKKAENAVRLRINRPTFVVCGTLQPLLHDLLGGERDGLRPRWLPHVASMPDKVGRGEINSRGWRTLLDVLVSARTRPRHWHFSPSALDRFYGHREGWKEQASKAETPSVAAALGKADMHLGRIALVLAEAEDPAAGGVVGPELVDRAARWVEFVLDCWRALPTNGSLGLTRRDERLDEGVATLLDWLERRVARRATRREIHRAHVAHVRTADDVDALLGRYEATFPGTIGAEQPDRGPATTIVRAPDRRPPTITVATGDSYGGSDGNARRNGGFVPRKLSPATLVTVSGDSFDGFRNGANGTSGSSLTCGCGRTGSEWRLPGGAWLCETCYPPPPGGTVERREAGG